jgi:hypothetical protein
MVAGLRANSAVGQRAWMVAGLRANSAVGQRAWMVAGLRANSAVDWRAWMVAARKVIRQGPVRLARPDHLQILRQEGLQEGWKAIRLAVGRLAKSEAYFREPLQRRFLLRG